MPKQKTRRLWLEIKYSAPGASFDEVRKKLIRSINNGTYRYPLDWKVVIRWSNRNPEIFDWNGWGEFTREMQSSKESSTGFDAAVISYLENAG